MSNQTPNIAIDGLTEKGFVLPNGYSWDVRIENGMKEGKVIVKNKMRMVHAFLYYHHDKLNGLCSFFKNGRIIEKRTYVNDVVEGWSCELERGGIERWFIYQNGKKISKLIKCEEIEGFWKEVEIDCENLISICQYDENHNKNGKCYLYKGNSIWKIVNFENGQEKDCYKEFNGNEMTE